MTLNMDFIHGFSFIHPPVIKLIRKLYASILGFLNKELWERDIKDSNWLVRNSIQLIKVIYLAYRGFVDDKVKLRASALTFFTLLSIVPVLAMAFGIAKGFGLSKELEKQIISRFAGQEEVMNKALDFANNLLENTRGGLIAGIGLILLIYSVMELLNRIESSFNDIWYISEERSLIRKFTDYIAIVLFAPVLLIFSNSATIFITNTIADLTNTVTLLGLFKGVIFPLLKLIPYVIIWILFTLIYIIIPNTRVKFKPAFIAGALAGTTFLIVQWGLIAFEINVSEYNAIYGSFAALPLFLIWLQVSWLIVLFGAELSYSIQNIGKFEYEQRKTVYSRYNYRVVTLLVMNHLVTVFKAGQKAPRLSEIARNLKIPSHFLKDILDDLISSGLVSRVSLSKYETGYQPAMDINQLTISMVLEKVDHLQNDLPAYQESENSMAVINKLASIQKLLEGSNENILVGDLLKE